MPNILIMSQATGFISFVTRTRINSVPLQVLDLSRVEILLSYPLFFGRGVST